MSVVRHKKSCAKYLSHSVRVGTLMKVTYRQIQASVKEAAGFVPKTDWIAHVKELNGLRLKQTYKTRRKRLEPCPPNKRKAIEDALRRFGFLPSGRNY